MRIEFLQYLMEFDIIDSTNVSIIIDTIDQHKRIPTLHRENSDNDHAPTKQDEEDEKE